MNIVLIITGFLYLLAVVSGYNRKEKKLKESQARIIRKALYSSPQILMTY